MNENQPDLVEQLHRQAVERRREEERLANELVEKVHREAWEHYQQQPQPPDEPLTIHYTELAEAKPDSPLYREWNFYRREVGRLLAEGNEGRHVLIKDEQIIGLWETHDEAMVEGYRRFLGQAFLVHQVQERERILRCVNVWLWPNLLS
jgi:hypothetical protein